MYFGRTDNSIWWVDIPRSDVKILRGPLVDVIDIGLELLESNFRAEFIERLFPTPDDKILPSGTQATLIRVSASSSSGHHFLEGDANGNMIYDPLHRLDAYRNRTITRFDAFKFITA